MDLTGRELWRQALTPGLGAPQAITLDIAPYPQGLYHVYLITDAATYAQKVLKQ